MKTFENPEHRAAAKLSIERAMRSALARVAADTEGASADGLRLALFDVARGGRRIDLELHNDRYFYRTYGGKFTSIQITLDGWTSDSVRRAVKIDGTELPEGAEAKIEAKVRELVAIAKERAARERRAKEAADARMATAVAARRAAQADGFEPRNASGSAVDLGAPVVRYEFSERFGWGVEVHHDGGSSQVKLSISLPADEAGLMKALVLARNIQALVDEAGGGGLSALVSAFRCPACEEFFLEPAGAIYECSRCGNVFCEDGSEDRRCPECGLFSALIADDSSPCCMEGDPESVECWQGRAGELFESEAAELEWIAGAPERERRRSENERWKAEHSEGRERSNRERNARLAPKIERLMPLLEHSMPNLGVELKRQLDDIRRDPGDPAGLVATLRFSELTELLLPSEFNELVAKACAYERGVAGDDRRAAELAVIDALRDRLAGCSFLDHLGHLTAGGAIGVPVEQAVDGLFTALAGKAKGEIDG